MRNTKKVNLPVYLLATTNLVHAVLYGFDWLAWATFGITVLAAVLDIMTALEKKGGRKNG